MNSVTYDLKWVTETTKKLDVLSIDISPNGGLVLTASYTEKCWRTWDCESGLECMVSEQHNGHRKCTCCVTRSGLLKTFDAACPVLAHRHNIRVARFSPCGKTIASGDIAGVVCMSDAKTGKMQFFMGGADRQVEMLSFSPDGAKLASAGYDGFIRIWDTSVGGMTSSLLAMGGVPYTALDGALSGDPVTSLHFCPTDSRLILSTTDASPFARTWNVETGLLAHSVNGCEMAFYSPNGQMIATLLNFWVSIYQTGTGIVQCRFNSLTARVRHMFFSLDGSKLIVVCGHTNNLMVFDSYTGHHLTTFLVPGPGRSMCFVMGRDWVDDLQRKEAFAMGHQSRLGEASPYIQAIDVGVIDTIIANV